MEWGQWNKKPRRVSGGARLHKWVLLFAEVYFDIPVLDLHGAILCQVELHFEGAIEQLRLMTDTFGQGFLLGHFKVVGEDRLILRMCALLDDLLGAITRAKAAEVGKTTLGNQNVEVMLGVVDMRRLRHDAGDPVRVGF